MKKKILVVLLATMIALSLTACSNTSVERGEKKTFDELPGEMKLNDSTLLLEDVSFYHTRNDYEWYVYATISIDISSLDEEEKHWLDKDASEIYDSDKTVNANVYLTCEDNNLDFDDMMSFGYSDVGDYRVYFFGSLDTYKNSFDNSKVTASINIKQDDTYKSEDSSGSEYEQNTENRYTYYITDGVKDVDDMPEDLLEAFNDRLSYY